jgi:hypothetical protein
MTLVMHVQEPYVLTYWSPTDEWPSATRTMFIGNQGIFEQYILIEEKNS